MSRRQYKFLPRQLEFRKLPRWRTLRFGTILIFLLGLGVGMWGGAYLLFRWYPSASIQTAADRYEKEKRELTALTIYKDTLERLTRSTDSIERHIYRQLVPATPSDTEAALTSPVHSVGNVSLSEDTIVKYLARAEEILRSLMKVDEVLQSEELRSPRLPRQLPCDCPDIGAGPGKLMHPLTGEPQMHEGIDFLVSEGKVIHTTAEGLVRSIEGDRSKGARVVIQHTSNLATVYYPVIPEVEPGQWVSTGVSIGRVARLAMSRMPVLHYEVLLNDKPTDPFLYLWGHFSAEERAKWKQATALQTNGLH
ncbi:MAG: M23 family metallopeptidase [Bacteroidia bacterium]|nr:M23 family metallopeptidase [Bacteroidia bacterium]MCX7651753.1 M23 family metallopeptidase [Bacteroidia bacterium]MDW8416375.1 M23 family metallopeptidase [Bacteroidia bacterium]